jgi:periplasmic protein TonB
VLAERPQGLAALWDRLWNSAKRRKAASLAIALALEALIVLLLLTLGLDIVGTEDGEETVTTVTAVEVAAPPAPEPESQPEPASDAATPQEPQPQTTDQPVLQPEPLRKSPLEINPSPAPTPAPVQAKPEPKASPSPKIGARIRPGPGAGPADTGNPRTAGDSQRVGTASNGEPLYAARWYREPTDQELSGYLSTANGPGSALIECRTVPDYYVDDCALLGESPQGSQIGRAVLAAAWQFRVRPARIGGREQVGSWVRIRIDYTVRQAPR